MSQKIRLADYIADFLVQHEIHDAFMVTGGGAMHLDDALGKNPGLHCTFNHHEQACSMAAEGYARVKNRMAAVCVTTGPGGTNAITGVMGAWLDSIPMFVISGQVRYDTTVRSTGIPLRQVGDQEFDITTSVKNMTKYAVMVTSPLMIRYHLERAFYLAMHGRRGPVWIDVPLNVQAAPIDPDELIPYNPAEDAVELPPKVSAEKAKKVIELLKNAKRPVIMAGSGIRYSGAYSEFIELVSRLNIPVVTPWNAHDNIWDEHPLYAGRPGNMGERAGNFVVQNSDLLLSIGCRLSIRQVSYNWDAFAREAYKIMVDIDKLELIKPTLNIDMPIHADAGDFIRSLLNVLSGDTLEPKQEWLEWCRDKRARYPVVLPEFYEKKSPVNPYCFMDKLFHALPENQVTVCGNGTACVVTFQAAYIKKGQRLFHNSGCASMGYGVPAAIGACIAQGRQKTICIDGDGSFQMNLQELATIAYNKLPVIIFLLNNDGYHSIRQTQTNYFGKPLVGVDEQSGIGFPDTSKIAAAYGIEFCRTYSLDTLEGAINRAISYEGGPFICEVMLDPEQFFTPKLSSRKLPNGTMVSAPLEDMAPFLPRDEFKSDMIIKPLQDE